MKKALALAALLAMLVFPLGTYAADVTVLTAVVPETVTLTVDIEGKGAVYVNGTALTKSGTVQIPRGIDVTLRADGGTVTVPDGLNLREADGTYILAAPVFDCAITVRFAEKRLFPPTGDDAWSAAYGILLLAAELSLLLILRKQRAL